tara:strand:+ start:9142 stop:9912 length:771 start_codon:yes stop_codon:yes gene_type:complete
MSDADTTRAPLPPASETRRVVISQPMYFPWPGFIEQMALADVYVWLDDAQFSKGSFTNRVQVKTAAGIKWMTIPLAGKGTMTDIADLKASDELWISSHRALLAQSLRGAPSAARAIDLFDKATSHAPLVDCLIASAEIVAASLGIQPKAILRTSELNLDGQSWRRVLDIVKSVGGTEYVTGLGAARYLDHQVFEDEGVAVRYMDYSLTPWPQQHGDFTPYVTALDLIATAGDEASSFLHPQTVPWREFLKSKGLPV